MFRIECAPRSCASAGACSANACMRAVGVALSTCTLSDESRRTPTMSSYRNRTHTSSGLRCTGSCSRSAWYCRYGSSKNPGSKGLKITGSPVVVPATSAT